MFKCILPIALFGILTIVGAQGGSIQGSQDSAATTLIQNVFVVDGTGRPGWSASMRILDDRILDVGLLLPGRDETVVEGGGKVLAPGFIDSHSHHDRELFDNRAVESASSQGITTAIVGQDGGSRYPLSEFISEFRSAPASINFGSYTGHNTLRDLVMGDDGRRPATDSEIARMQALLKEDMAAGSLGLSTGLGYETGIFSSTEEVVALAQVSARHGGRYISHIRNENVAVLEAVDEAIEVGRRTGVPVQISHIKLGAISTWGQADRVIAMLESARAEGIAVSADVYPYAYWQTTMRILFPDKNYKNPEGIEWAFEKLLPPGNVHLSEYAPDRSLEGKTIADIAAQRRTDPVAVYVALMQEAIEYEKDHEGRAESIIGTSMAEEDIDAFLRWPGSNICSDGSPVGGHPRGYGAFTRVLGRYVREKKLLSLEEAVHKMTGLTARHLGLANRGILRPGAYADLVLFDPDVVRDRAVIGDSTALSDGILKVWVNGKLVFSEGGSTGEYPGRIVSQDLTFGQEKTE